MAGASCFSGDHFCQSSRSLPVAAWAEALCRCPLGLAPDLTALFGLHPSAVYAFLNLIVGGYLRTQSEEVA